MSTSRAYCSVAGTASRLCAELGRPELAEDERFRRNRDRQVNKPALTEILNGLLAVFNLLPVPPLDGSRVVDGVLPDALRRPWEAFASLGPMGLVFVIVAPLVRQSSAPPSPPSSGIPVRFPLNRQFESVGLAKRQLTPPPLLRLVLSWMVQRRNVGLACRTSAPPPRL